MISIVNEYRNLDFRQLEFEFKGKKAIVILPNEKNKNGKAVLKTEYFGAFTDLQMEFVKRGYTLLFIENRNRWGTDSELDDQYEFVKLASKEFDIEPRVITIGMSCGGLISVKLCAKYPEIVSGLYLDAPVMNFLSCPGSFGDSPEVTEGMWHEFEKAYGMTKRDLLTYREHPLDKVHILIENKKPVFMVYGDSDLCVPYCENGISLEKQYREAGATLEIEVKKGCGHHPHGPTDYQRVIDFFEKN